MDIHWKTPVQNPMCVQKVKTTLKIKTKIYNSHALENAYLFLDIPITMTNVLKDSKCTGGPFVIQVTITDKLGRDFVSETVLYPLALFQDNTEVKTFTTDESLLYTGSSRAIKQRNTLWKNV